MQYYFDYITAEAARIMFHEWLAMSEMQGLETK